MTEAIGTAAAAGTHADSGLDTISPDPDAALAAIEADPVAAVAAWGACATGAPDPVRLHMAQALARRAVACQGPARARMAERLARWLAEDAGTATAAVPVVPDTPAPAPGALQALSALVDRLGRTAARPLAPGSLRLTRAEAPPLKAVAAHAGTWSRLRVQQRLRHAQAQVPAQAGPLHSARLVHGALQTLNDLAPAYLTALVTQVESLQWLEQATGGDLPPRAPGRGAEPARRGRRRADGAG